MLIELKNVNSDRKGKNKKKRKEKRGSGEDQAENTPGDIFWESKIRYFNFWILKNRVPDFLRAKIGSS